MKRAVQRVPALTQDHHFQASRWGLRVGLLLSLLLWSFASHAQLGGGGVSVYLTGMVQVEPGSDVVTMQVKEDKIRFVIHDVQGTDRNFPAARFTSDVTRRDPGLYIKGAEKWLDLLLNERPNKRALRLNGLYYPDSHFFMVRNIRPVRESRTPGR
ncbi:MAG: hypothetical protein AB7G75_19370 [Candidatus Binatia bacterium]